MDYYEDRRNEGDTERGAQQGEVNQSVAVEIWQLVLLQPKRGGTLLRMLPDKAGRRVKIKEQAERVHEGQNEDLGGAVEGGSGPSSSWSPL